MGSVMLASQRALMAKGLPLEESGGSRVRGDGLIVLALVRKRVSESDPGGSEARVDQVGFAARGLALVAGLE